MTARIRQLEDALQSAQTQASSNGTPSPPLGGFGSSSDHSPTEFSALVRRQSQVDHANSHINPLIDSYIKQSAEQAQASRRARVLNMLPGENVAWDLVEKYYGNHGWL